MNAAFVDLSRNRTLLRLVLAPMLTLLLVFSLTARPAHAAPSGLTYLGQLLVGGVPANGSYDLQFQLFNAATGGTQVGPTVSLTSVPVAQGLYFASLYFGTNIFTGQTLWLQISYRVHPSSGNPPYTTLSPRNVAPNSAFADYAQLSGSTAALQGFSISTTAPTTGQVLQWNGSLWTPTTSSGGGSGSYTAGTGLTLSGTQFSVTTGGITSSLLANSSVTGAKLSLPLTASVSSSSDLFTLTNTGSGRALVGNSSSNTAVKGVGYNGVYGQGTNYGVQASGTNYGVYSVSPAVGVYGSGTGSSGTGIYGIGGTSGYGIEGVYGTASGLAATDSFFYSGVLGDTTTGNGVIGSTSATNGDGVVGIAGPNAYAGVYGRSASTTGVGVSGSGGQYGLSGSGTTYGAYGSGGNGGVYGINSSSSAYGILGTDQYDGAGVLGKAVADSSNGVVGVDKATGGYAVWGVGDNTVSGNYAGFFSGNVAVSGTLTAGTKDFKIDHPLDPAHQYLSHASIESDKMEDIYNGHVSLDAAGAATVTLPTWFQALNTEFEYHLTPIGAPAPNLYIAQEVQDNKFQIAGGSPGLKVSWQVTGVRHDAFALAHPLQVEEDKPKEEQGLYQNPEAFGLPANMGIQAGRDQSISQHQPKLHPPKLPAAAAPQ